MGIIDDVIEDRIGQVPCACDGGCRFCRSSDDLQFCAACGDALVDCVIVKTPHGPMDEACSREEQ